MPIYDDIVANADVTYVAGGAAQNAARGASVSRSFSYLRRYLATSAVHIYSGIPRSSTNTCAVRSSSQVGRLHRLGR